MNNCFQRISDIIQPDYGEIRDEVEMDGGIVAPLRRRVYAGRCDHGEGRRRLVCGYSPRFAPRGHAGPVPLLFSVLGKSETPETSKTLTDCVRRYVGALGDRALPLGNGALGDRALPSGSVSGASDESEFVSTIEKTAQGILDARALYPDSSLADLYDPLTMPPELRKAHQANDAAVMKAYGFPPDLTEPEIVSKLFEMYAKLTENVKEAL